MNCKTIIGEGRIEKLQMDIAGSVSAWEAWTGTVVAVSPAV
jgi:hypothetical protein